ncbi:MAG: hypothetical protein ACD_42C00492G0001 [uncultured bacterium]|nr:MAG: hypothetical protein ACD_42C00492G0001 [uncultured bacterium]
MMFKHILMLIGLSVAAIFFQDQLMQVLKFFMYVHTQLANGLGVIFSVDKIGEVVQSVLALLLIPVVVGVLIAIAHFFIRQHHFPHTMTAIWVCWAVILVSVLSQTGRVTNHTACFSSAQTAQNAPGAQNPQAKNAAPIPQQR